MGTEQEQLQIAIAALETQRAVLGDAVVEAAVAPLRAKVAALAAAQPAAAEQTLRQVTILFLDFVGSTNLSERLDPEDIHAVVDGALARCTAIVESHEGKVLQYAGDSLLAAFGAAEAREDDPERAVRAGLALLAQGRLLSDEVQHRHGHEGFNVRVGIHTGRVLLGGGVDAEGTIRGLAVNIAARMEQTAPSGSLRISHETFQHVRGLFDTVEQEPILLKGIAEPLRSYLVHRERPLSFGMTARGIEGIETRMVGRDAQFDRLKAAFLSLAATRRLSALSIVGDAGMGKSRLLFEFERWVQARSERFHLFKGGCHQQRRNRPYGLLRDILSRRFQIADNDPVAVVHRKFVDGVVPLFLDDGDAEMANAHAHLLGQLAGFDFSDSLHVKGIAADGQQLRHRGFHAAAQLIHRTSGRDNAPVLLLLDDLHWADDASLDLVAHLLEVDHDMPLLVAASARPGLYEREDAAWNRAGAITERIDLVALSEPQSLELASDLLQRLDEVPRVLSELITGGAEGNPFYMEELVKMLIDVGAIVADGQRWTVAPDKLAAAHVPATLVGVLQARLDSLAPTETTALQLAAVIGHVFWEQTLAMLDADAPSALEALLRRDLIVRHGKSSFEGLSEFAFRHHTLHQVTYASVLRRVKRDAHGRVARWLAQQPDATHQGLIAEHFENAGETALAYSHYTLAAEDALSRHAHQAMLSFVERAMALAGADDPVVRWRLLAAREKYLTVQGDRAAQAADLDAMQALADTLDDDARRAEVALRRAFLLKDLGDFRGSDGWAERARLLAERAGASAIATKAYKQRAFAMTRLGDYAAARQLAEAGLRQLRSDDDIEGEAHLVNVLNIIAGDQGDLGASLAHAQRFLHLCCKAGNRSNECMALNNLSDAYIRLGDYASARRHLEQGLRLANTVGRREVEALALVNLANVALRQRDHAQALHFGQQACEIADHARLRYLTASAQHCLGDAHLAVGNAEQARSSYVQASELFQQVNMPRLAMEPIAGLARLALAQRDTELALEQVELVMAHLAAGGTLDGTDQPFQVRLTCYRVLAACADARAPGVLADAHAELMGQARCIADDFLRQCFLNGILEHREILAASTACAAQNAAQS